MERKHLRNIALISLSVCMALISNSHAVDLSITDSYLDGLSDEIDSPEYLEKARLELLETEKRESSGTINSIEIQQALASMYKFETLMRTKYPSSHATYSKLPASSRIRVYEKFKSSKRLSAAKRMIIEKYESR